MTKGFTRDGATYTRVTDPSPSTNTAVPSEPNADNASNLDPLAAPLKPLTSKLGGWIERALRLTAGLTSLLLLFGFIFSVVLNSLVFAKWELDFLQMASTQDVLMSGMQIALDAALPLIIILIVSASTYLLLHLSVKHLTFEKALNRIDIIIYLSTIIVAIFGTIFLSIHTYLFKNYQNSFFNPTYVKYSSLLSILFFSFFTSIYIFIYRYVGSFFSALNKFRNPIGLISINILMIFLTISSFIYIAFAIEMRAARGFLTNNIFSQAGNERVCSRQNDAPKASKPPHARLLWSGSEYLVLRCSQGDYTQIIALRNFEEVRIYGRRERVEVFSKQTKKPSRTANPDTTPDKPPAKP